MSRVVSLRGAIFAFHCLPPVEQHELAARIVHANGKLYSKANARKSNVVYMITSFWTDCDPRAEFHDVLLHLVTPFWLHEMLRLGRWLDPAGNQFFEPPPRSRELWLHYPLDYQELHEVVDKDRDKQDASRNPLSLRVRLPCSPTFQFRGEVPLWPYIAAYLAQPMHDVAELTARLQLYEAQCVDNL